MAMDDYFSDADRVNYDAPVISDPIETCNNCPYCKDGDCTYAPGCFCWGCEFADDDSGDCTYSDLGCVRWKED